MLQCIKLKAGRRPTHPRSCRPAQAALPHRCANRTRLCLRRSPHAPAVCSLKSERSSAGPVRRTGRLPWQCPRGTASNVAARVASAAAVDDAGGASDGAAVCACDLCQRQLRHGSWWPNRDAKRICACVASRRRAAADSVDRVWFSGGGARNAADNDCRWYLPGARDPRNCADSCSCPCRCVVKRNHRFSRESRGYQ